MSYLIINESCMPVYGENAVTVMNFETNKDVTISGEKFKLFQEWHRGGNVEENEDIEAAEQLKKIILDNKIGIFSERFYINPTYRKGKKRHMHQELDNSLKRAFFQIPSACDHNCSYCQKDIVSSCWVCTKDESKKFDVREEYTKLINQLFHIGCRQITLHGENVLQAENIYDFLEEILKNQIRVDIVCHEKNLNEATIEKLSHFRISLIVNYDYSVGKKLDSCQDKINLLKKFSIPFCFSVIFSEQTIKELPEVMEFLSKQEIMLLNKGLILEDINKISLDELKYMCKQDVDYNVYSFMQDYNMCLYSTIAINSNLEILPCPRMTNRILGKLDRDNPDITQNFAKETNLAELWFMKKESIDKCKKCSRRYLCLECRQIEEKITKVNNGKRDCFYLDSKEEC